MSPISDGGKFTSQFKSGAFPFSKKAPIGQSIKVAPKSFLRSFLGRLAGPIYIGVDAGTGILGGGDPLRETLRAGTTFGTGVLGGVLGAPIPVPGTRFGGFLGGSYLGGQAFDALWPDPRGSEITRNVEANLAPDAVVDRPLPTRSFSEPPASSAVRDGLVIPNEVPVTEGPGTKLITMPDGSARRVPVDQNIPGSTVMSVDGVPVTEKVDNFLADAKTAWLAKTANSPAAKAGFDEDDRWNLHMNDQAWRKEMGRDYNQDLGPYLQPYSSETQWK